MHSNTCNSNEKARYLDLDIQIHYFQCTIKIYYNVDDFDLILSITLV